MKGKPLPRHQYWLCKLLGSKGLISLEFDRSVSLNLAIDC